MFGNNIIPDDMVYGFYDKKPNVDVSNNIDLSNNVDLSNNIDLSNNKINTNNYVNMDFNNIKGYLYGGDFDDDYLCYFIAPIDDGGNKIIKRR
jgi:hypothetical protein